MKQNEINKKIALSDSSTNAANSSGCNQKIRLASKPLIEQTQKAVSEVLFDKSHSQLENRKKKEQSLTGPIGSATCDSTESHLIPSRVEADKVVLQQHLDFRERREKELKFTAAGWKRDGHGKWYRDENVSIFLFSLFFLLSL